MGPTDMTKKQVYEYVAKVKSNLKPSELVEGIDTSGHFHQFAKEIFALEFDKKPNYAKLQQRLVECLIHRGEKNDN